MPSLKICSSISPSRHGTASPASVRVRAARQQRPYPLASLTARSRFADANAEPCLSVPSSSTPRLLPLRTAPAGPTSCQKPLVSSDEGGEKTGHKDCWSYARPASSAAQLRTRSVHPPGARRWPKTLDDSNVIWAPIRGAREEHKDSSRLLQGERRHRRLPTLCKADALSALLAEGSKRAEVQLSLEGQRGQ